MMILLRFDGGREEAIEFDELSSRIRNGLIGPSTLTKNKFLTNDRWEALNETEFFHRRSPIRHDAGPRLSAQRAEARDREEAGRRRADILAQAPALDARLGIQPVDVLARLHNGWAARLVTLPSFEPPNVITVVRGELEVTIELLEPIDIELQLAAGVLISRSSRLGEILFASNGPDFDASDPSIFDIPAKRRFAVRPTEALGAVVEPISRHAPAAMSCSTLALDGVGYTHSYAHIDGHSATADWSNPDNHIHAPQTSIVRVYAQLRGLIPN